MESTTPAQASGKDRLSHMHMDMHWKVRLSSTTPGWIATAALMVGLLFGMGMGVGVSLKAQDVAAAAGAARSDLDQALKALAEARQRIEAERIPMARSVYDLEQKVIDDRRELEKRQRFQENQLVELNSLKSEVRAREDEVKYVETLMAEHARTLRSRAHVVEAGRMAPVWGRYDAAVGATDISVKDQMERKAELLKVAFDRLEGLIGGDRFEAEVLGPRNVIERGQVVLAGPLGLFASDGGDGVGLVEQELNRADPSVLSPGNEFQQGIRKLMESGEGEIPLDASLGNAFKIQTTREGVWEHLMKGGVVIWPMMALALAAVLVATVKWVEISRIRPASFSDLTQILRDLKESKRDAALRHAKGLPGPSGALLVAAVEHAHEKKEYIEEVLYEQMLRTKPKIERWLPFLALTAAASPLLGLLGTVTGMISTFNMISLFGTGDPKTLSGGISEALITTECGLYIAIPALLVHAMLQRKAKGIMGGMEQMSVGFINGLPTRTIDDAGGVLASE